MANIGKSITIHGDVTGEEDMVIEGRIEGRVELEGHHLTIGPNGDVTGEISAHQLTVVGRVKGNVRAAERVELCDTSQLTGDILAPKLLIQEGAQFNGHIAMQAPSARTGHKADKAGANKSDKSEAPRAPGGLGAKSSPIAAPQAARPNILCLA